MDDRRISATPAEPGELPCYSLIGAAAVELESSYS
jgi:hypothetical protein